MRLTSCLRPSAFRKTSSSSLQRLVQAPAAEHTGQWFSTSRSPPLPLLTSALYPSSMRLSASAFRFSERLGRPPSRPSSPTPCPPPPPARTLPTPPAPNPPTHTLIRPP